MEFIVKSLKDNQFF
jgi:hypothetical protein